MKVTHNKNSVKKSPFFNLHWKDVGRGALIAVVTAILTSLIALLDKGEFPTTFAAWQPILYPALGAGLAYILKNLLTNSNDELLKTEKKAA